MIGQKLLKRSLRLCGLRGGVRNSSDISFAGKVAIITGAGGALGQAYALDLARRNCNLLLNDIGAALSGDDTGATKANVVVLAEKINALGKGKAIVSTENVLRGDLIVKQAMDAFGRVDILVNNAGNLRDKSFAKMTAEDWHKVIDVHLHGTFAVSHAAWPIMQAANSGRIINISSGAGLYGNFGQANYSSAKMGILGLTQTLAKEGAKSNIKVNCVVPVAASRMTETVLSADLLKELQPAQVAPLVSYLASEGCAPSGSCFEVGGGWFSQVRLQRSAGVSMGENTSAEALGERMTEVSRFDDRATYPTSAADAMQAIMMARDRGSAPAASPATPKASAPAVPQQTIVMRADGIFMKLDALLLSDPARASEVMQKVKANVLVNVTADGAKDSAVAKQWLLQLHPSGSARVLPYAEDPSRFKTATTLSGSDSTICGLFDGSLSAEFAYLRGKLRIDGHMGVAMKIKRLLEVAQTLSK